MEWAYNNTCHPFAEYSSKFNKKLPFLDGSRANSIKNLGCSLKLLWKEFKEVYGLSFLSLDEIDINAIEDLFWKYFISKHAVGFERSVEIFKKYVSKRISLMTKEQRDLINKNIPLFADDENWMLGCRDYLKHLIYTSPRGYICELIILDILRDHTNGFIRESSIEDERKGIDGYIISQEGKTYPISLKPSTYKPSHISPLYDRCLITYNKYNKENAYNSDLIFEFQSGDDIIRSCLKGAIHN